MKKNNDKNREKDLLEKFIIAYKTFLKNPMTKISFKSNPDGNETIYLSLDTDVFTLYQQKINIEYYTINKKYQKILDCKYKLEYSEKDDKITHRLKKYNNFIYRFIYGDIWIKNNKVINKNIIKYNNIYVEVLDNVYYIIYNDTINMEKYRNLQNLDFIINNDKNTSFFQNKFEKSALDIIDTFRNIIGNDIFLNNDEQNNFLD